MSKKPMTAVIDAGGGMRGAYAAGLLDYCLDHGILFDLCIGVSAGATNLSSYLAGQRGRNRAFYTGYLTSPEYISRKNLRSKHLIADLDYVCRISAPDGKDPLDFEALMATDQQFVIVATDAQSGRPVYFGKEDLDPRTYWALKASCSIPMISSPYSDRKTPYFDGTISDPIPVKEALQRGAQKIVVIINRPADGPRNLSEDRFMKRLLKNYPKTARRLEDRTRRYDETLGWIRQLEKQGRALLVYPDSTLGVHTLSQDPKALDQLYLKGYSDGKRIQEFLED